MTTQEQGATARRTYGPGVLVLGVVLGFALGATSAGGMSGSVLAAVAWCGLVAFGIVRVLVQRR